MGLSNTVKNSGGDVYWERVDGYGRRLVNEAWTHVLTSDTGTNDSDKTITVPALKEWHVQSILVELTTSSTAGSRHIVIEILNGSSDIMQYILQNEGDQAEDTEYHYSYSRVTSTGSDTVGSIFVIMTSIGDLILPAGYSIRVYDSAAIAAAADDMIVHVRVLQRDLFEEPS